MCIRDRSSGEESPFELDSIEPGELSEAALRQSDVAVLLNVGNLSAAQAGAIAEYVSPVVPYW